MPHTLGASCQSLYIGLMTGTSLDGVDGVLAHFPDAGPPHVVARASLPLPAPLRAEFLSLNSPGPNELARAATAGIELARLYAQTCSQLLKQQHTKPGEVKAIGVHGQTVRHAPAKGYSIQINAPATLAELSGIDVIADFRSRDIAAGGQGAPLVPAFHQQLFSAKWPRVVLNLGGIANITVLHPAKPLSGFDTGPANALLDMWCHEKTGQPFDDNGRWAATGTSHPALLAAFLAEPWFLEEPPKSTGRDLFNRQWIEDRLAPVKQQYSLSDADVQATLLSLTAQTVADAIGRYARETEEIIVCGGGANNRHLLDELQHRTGVHVISSSTLGILAQDIEALAFAWLAKAHVNRQTTGSAVVTGASGERVLGCCYPA